MRDGSDALEAEPVAEPVAEPAAEPAAGAQDLVVLHEFELPTTRSLRDRIGLPLPDVARAARLLEQLEARADIAADAATDEVPLAGDERVSWQRYKASRQISFAAGVILVAGLLLTVCTAIAGYFVAVEPVWLKVSTVTVAVIFWCALAAGLATIVVSRRLRFVMHVMRAATSLVTMRRWGGDTSGAVVDSVSRASIALFNLATMKWFSPMVPPVLQNYAARQAYSVISPLYVDDFTGIYAHGDEGAAARRRYASYLHDIGALVAVGRSDLVSLYSASCGGLKGTLTSANEVDISDDMMDYFIPVKGSRGITFIKEGIVPFASLMSVTIAVVALILSRTS